MKDAAEVKAAGRRRLSGAAIIWEALVHEGVDVGPVVHEVGALAAHGVGDLEDTGARDRQRLGGEEPKGATLRYGQAMAT